jgi:serine/tyrosine/threonine adenylyltransferase
MPDTLVSPLRWNLDHSYAALPPDFYSAVRPTAVKQPTLLRFNTALAEFLGLGATAPDANTLAALFSGNTLPEGAFPMAQAYAGHQFGHFTMLGDGRAILLGEQLTPAGNRFDIQLKGAGPTPYSRRGDGRATVAAMLREYVISEAMHHLGIPTSRSLAVVATGMHVYRDPIQPGAVLTRVASSHLRVGTFEYARQFLPDVQLKALLDYSIQRHYPDMGAVENPAAEFLFRVLLRQVDLIVHWMRVGFIHGVMNTDNMSIAGESIDYGPCAFMNAYHPQTVFSSIDTQGRYAFSHQPAIAQWNLAVLAGALMPMLDAEEEKAVAIARNIIDGFNDVYARQWLRMMCGKLGLSDMADTDGDLARELLQWMALRGADYTNTFLYLEHRLAPQPVPEAEWLRQSTPPADDPSFEHWVQQWEQRISRQPGGAEAARALMRTHNPVFIPRNHQVEAALAAASFDNDMGPLDALLEVLRQPYRYQPGKEQFMLPPAGGDKGYRTFCGT